MKQLLQALTGDTPSATTTRRAPRSALACVAPRPDRPRFGPYVGSDLAMGRSIVTTGRLATLTLHGSNGLMVLPTNAHRRPPETPT